MKKIIAITGLHGTIGKKIFDSLNEDFKKEYLFVDLFHSNENNFFDKSIHLQKEKFDLFDTKEIVNTLKKINPTHIIHMAAITHIDKCQEDAGLKKKSRSWIINVSATEEIVKYCQIAHAHLIFISTECVFDGESNKKYLEESPTNPKNWYGYTKSEAEKIITNSSIDWTIIRGVIAYDISQEVETIFSAIKKSFMRKKEFFVVSDQKFTPSYIPDIHKTIWEVVKNKHTGIFHVTPKKSLTPYQFAIDIGKYFSYDLSLVKKQKMKDYFGLEKAKLRLKNATLSSIYSSKVLKIVPKTIVQVLEK